MRGFSSTYHNGVTVISFGPDFDTLYEATIATLQQQLLDAFDEADPPWVVLDLGRAKFFGSAFIGLLMQLGKRIERRDNGRFALCSLSPFAQAALATMKLGDAWPMYESRGEAVRALSNGRMEA